MEQQNFIEFSLIETVSTADSTDSQNHDDLLQTSTQEECKELPEKITNAIEIQKDLIPDAEPNNFRLSYFHPNRTIENLQPEVGNVEDQSCQVEKSIVEDFEEFNDQNKENMLTINGVDRTITPVKTRKSVLASFDPLYVPSPVVEAQKELVNPIIEESSDEMADNNSYTEDEMAQIELNAAQQACASLELELRQKEEVYIKSQVEWSRNEQMYLQDIKKLQEKLELKGDEKLIEPDLDRLELAEETNKKLEVQLSNYEIVLRDYENFIATQTTDYLKLKDEDATVKMHLANLELAFTDIHQKYERSKSIIMGFKQNEETFCNSLSTFQSDIKKSEEKFEALKAHATAQLEKANKGYLDLKDKYEVEVQKLITTIKRLEIKVSSLIAALEQKTEESCALAALCDEVTGKV